MNADDNTLFGNNYGYHTNYYAYYYYTFNSNCNLNEVDFKEIQLLRMFKEYIDICYTDIDPESVYKRSRILLCYPELIDRLFIFWCLQNNLQRAKQIHNYLKNEDRIQFGKTIICDEFIIHLVRKTLNNDIYYEILGWIIKENILSQIDYFKIIKYIIKQNDYCILVYLLDLLCLNNPSIIYQEYTTDYDDDERNIIFIDMFHKLFDFIVNENLEKYASLLKIYRPYQYDIIVYRYYDGICRLDYNSEEFTKIQYPLIKQKLDMIPEGCEISLREALIRNRFHPKYANKWIEWGHNISEDFE